MSTVRSGAIVARTACGRSRSSAPPASFPVPGLTPADRVFAELWLAAHLDPVD